MRESMAFWPFYYLFLLAANGAVVCFAASLQLMRKRALAPPIIGLFSLYLLDTAIIFMTVIFSFFKKWYDLNFLTAPSIKTLMYIGITYFTLSVWNALVGKRFSTFQAVVLCTLSAYLLLMPLMKLSALRVWLYYLAYQLFTICVSGYGLWKLRRLEPNALTGEMTWLGNLLIVNIVCSVLITAYDTWGIFGHSNYDLQNPKLGYGNLCEDLLRLIYAGFFFFLFLRRFRYNWLAEDEPPEPDTEPPSVPSEPVTVLSPDYKQYCFCKQLGLTGRETDVCTCVLSGRTLSQISEELHISAGTVKTHVHSIYQKAGISRRFELMESFDSFIPSDSVSR